MPWHADLQLHYVADGLGGTGARHRHRGPLRILKSLYPEGPGVCHNVLVHPPGGLVGGDVLDVAVTVDPHAHGLVTTPGATRFYRSDGAPALQVARVALAPGARCEWLPLEAIYYPGCVAENRLVAQLEPGSQMIGWDVLALGLPMAGQPFAAGRVLQHLEWPGVWLERGHIDASDTRLLQSELGLAGRHCLASVFFLSGSPLPRGLRERALEDARAVIDASPLAAFAGASSPDARVVVVRAVSPLVEPAMALLRGVRAAWRAALWALPAGEPRVWAM